MHIAVVVPCKFASNFFLIDNAIYKYYVYAEICRIEETQCKSIVYLRLKLLKYKEIIRKYVILLIITSNIQCMYLYM